MKINNATQSSQADTLTEIVFASRNKSYGAYELRRDYNDRMQSATIITLVSLSLLLLLLIYSSSDIKNIVDNSPLGGKEVVMDNYDITQPKIEQIVKSASPISKDIFVVSNDTTEEVLDTTSKHITSSGTVTGGLPGNPTSGGGNGGAGKKIIDTTDYSKPFISVSQMPEFEGGESALIKYLSKNIKGTERWKEDGESGNIIFSIIIDKNGDVTDIEVLRDDVGFGCADNARQVIKNMPRWKAGRQNDIPVSVKYILPITMQKVE